MHALDGMSLRNCFIRLLRTAKIRPICSFNKSRGPYGIANIPLTEMHIKRTDVLPFLEASVLIFFCLILYFCLQVNASDVPSYIRHAFSQHQNSDRSVWWKYPNVPAFPVHSLHPLRSAAYARQKNVSACVV